MSCSLQLASTWISGQTGTPVSQYLTDPAQATLFANPQPRITPFSFVYVEQPPTENSVTYGGTATFKLEKTGDLLCNTYLVLQTSPINYMPIRDESITRACFLADLPAEPQEASLGGLSRLDTQATWIDYMAYVMLDSATFGNVGSQPVETLTGDYLMMMNDEQRRQDQNFITTLPDNEGGSNNLGNGTQRLYVPLLFSFAKKFQDAFPIKNAQYSTQQIRVKLGPAPFRGDATSFEPPGYDPVACAEYAAANGADVLPHEMYERYAELRAGALASSVGVSCSLQNQDQRQQGDFLPLFVLSMATGGASPFTTSSAAVSANTIKLVRRRTYQFDVSALQAVIETALVQPNDASQVAFVWDYANTGAQAQLTLSDAGTRTGPGEPTASSLRLYGQLASGTADLQVTIKYAGMQAYQVTTQSTAAGAPAAATVVEQMPSNAAQSWAGAGAVPVRNAPGTISFRVDPFVQGQLQTGDTWTFTLGNRALPLTLVLSDQPWGNALPADYYEAPAGTSSVMFQYTGALCGNDSRLNLTSKASGSLPGFQFPSWLSELDNGNILYYHTGSATPAVARIALAGTAVGVFSDNLNWDYLHADPGQRVDALSPSTGNALVATDASGLFYPLFPGRIGQPAVGSFPNGIPALPVYCYRVTDDPTYHEAVYRPVVVGQSLQKFTGPSADIGGELTKVSLLTNNIFLGDQEGLDVRSKNYQKLYTELQQQSFRLVAGATGPVRLKLDLTGPVKALTFFFRPDIYNVHRGGSSSDQYWNWQLTNANKDQDIFSSATLVLNNQAMFQPPRDPVFFKHMMPTQYRTSTPRQRTYNIPFSANPDCDGPMGSINMSLYDSIELVMEYSNGNVLQDTGTLWVYAETWNVQSIRSGQLSRVFVH